MATLDQRLTTLERVSKPASRVTVVRLVAVGGTDRPMTQISHHGSGKTWHIAPGESEQAFIARARAEVNEPRMVLLAQ